jgi:hypothetical protein
VPSQRPSPGHVPPPPEAGGGWAAAVAAALAAGEGGGRVEGEVVVVLAVSNRGDVVAVVAVVVALKCDVAGEGRGCPLALLGVAAEEGERGGILSGGVGVRAREEVRGRRADLR